MCGWPVVAVLHPDLVRAAHHDGRRTRSLRVLLADKGDERISVHDADYLSRSEVSCALRWY